MTRTDLTTNLLFATAIRPTAMKPARLQRHADTDPHPDSPDADE